MTETPIWFQYPKFQWNEKHAIIIGGGIAGAQIAWHLCQTGWQVTLIERHNQLALEASGNPAGVISPKMTAKKSLGEDFYTQSFLYTLSQLNKLKQLGHKITMDNCGVLQLAHNPREEQRWQALGKRNFPANLIQLLDEDETIKTAGINLNTKQPYKSYYFPKGGWIQPASFVKALIDHPHCNVITQTEALKLVKSSNDWQVYNQKDQLVCKSEIAIIANGKDLFSFEQTSFLPGMPVAGQTTSSIASNASKKLKAVIGHEGYLTPALPLPSSSDREDHIFGATFERDNSNPQLNTSSDHQNVDSLQHYLPEFANNLGHISSAHTAVRMTTPDRFPYVGGLPSKAYYQQNYHDLHQGKQWKKYPTAKYQNGLFVLGGLGSRGIITSGYCAKALCDLLENKLDSEQTRQVLKNCHPARYIIKKLRTQD